MSGIFWLASYPKSGNTWLRALLTNYLRDAEEPVDINALDFGGEGFMRENFDERLGIDSTDLTSAQISHYRPLVYEQMAEAEETLFIKVHDAYEINRDGRAIFSEKATRGAIYLMRNPLDVAVSYAHHENESVDRTIQRMSSANACVSNCLNAPYRRRGAAWSDHVTSWVDAPNLNIHLVRYENLKEFTAEVFSEIVRFAGLCFDEQKIEKAVEFSRFEVLQKQEARHGFKEKQPTAESFFRRGKTGDWREILTQNQVARIIDDHREVMKRFGYLGVNNEILC